MTTKILIYVEGGTVQYVNSNQEDTQIVIIDKDQLENGGTSFISSTLAPDSVYDNHFEAFTDESNPVDMEVREELKTRKF